MAEILISGPTEILRKLVGFVSKDIGSALAVKDDLKKLQSRSEIILAVIADAEKRQEKEELVRLWLTRIKAIAYDIDDVMDEFSYEDMRREVLNFPSSSKPSFAFRLKMAKQIKDINKTLEQITHDIDRFQLEFTTPVTDGESTEQLDREYTSHVIESEIVGRENDETHIIKLLTIRNAFSSSSSFSTSSENISVISIVGMGGLGKTTLAQLAYKHELISKVFELKMWVHVSEIFDIQTILVRIMESITGTKFHEFAIHTLGKIVQEKLEGKKYLLVLDDLWNEDLEQWRCLMSVLLAGAAGSKILITTRNDQVASIVRGNIPPYNLNLLTDDACWSIVKQRAFSPGGALNDPQMSDIGKQIAKKCCGLPLAAKFLGGLLRSKNRESDWISIRDDDNWNTPQSKGKVLPVLKMSYNHLPPHLKQCFSYCSIFPKNWEIKKETLVHLWMAEGFLKKYNTKNIISVEDFGCGYFESLAWSSFFHDFKKNDIGDIETCKMHDIVHDLAKDVAGENEVVSLKISELKDVSVVRRLQLHLDEDISSTESLKSLSNAKKLRTLFIPEGSNLVDPSIFSENKYLRVLHVGPSPIPSYPKFPSLSVKLRHLRYLHLTSIDLREVENDQSINKLYNLETLVLSYIASVQNLLSSIHSLKKLRYLEISYTDMVELPDSVTSLSSLRTLDLRNCELKVIPDSISGLKSLRFLNMSDNPFEELPDSVTSLSSLQTLDLHNCELKVIPDSISGLKSLRFLNMSDNPFEELPVSVTTLSNLETLHVNTCKNLKALPEYVAGLSKLRLFDFQNCLLLRELPNDFGALTQLRSLDLDGTEILVLPESCVNLNNLEHVYLYWCEVPKDVKNWPKLKSFYYRRQNPILGLGKLIFLEELFYMVPEKLNTEPEGNEGIEELGNLNFLEHLSIANLQNVKDPVDAERANLKGKHNLRTLDLYWGIDLEEEVDMMMWDQNSCNFQVFEALQPPKSLNKLGIYKFMGSDLPMWMSGSGFPDLILLDLVNCVGIKQLPASIRQLPRLSVLFLEGMLWTSLEIGGFPSLLSIVLTDMLLLEELSNSYPSCLQELIINGCKSLTEIPSFPSLTELKLVNVDSKLVCSVGRSHTSLTKLILENIEELIYFPIRILQNNCNIQSLRIRGCNQLEGFGVIEDEKENMVPLYGPGLYTGSLLLLYLIDCPIFKFLPDLRGWTSLRDLCIFNCPQVKESLTYDLRDLSFLNELGVDFIQRDQKQGDPTTPLELINLMNK